MVNLNKPENKNMAMRKKVGYLSLAALLCSVTLLAGCNKTEKDSDSMVDNSSWNNSVTEGTNTNEPLEKDADAVDNQHPNTLSGNNQETTSTDKNVVGNTQGIGNVIENTIENVTNAIENAADTAKDSVTDDTNTNTTQNSTKEQKNVVQNSKNRMSSSRNRTTVNQ